MFYTLGKVQQLAKCSRDLDEVTVASLAMPGLVIDQLKRAFDFETDGGVDQHRLSWICGSRACVLHLALAVLFDCMPVDFDALLVIALAHSLLIHVGH